MKQTTKTEAQTTLRLPDELWMDTKRIAIELKVSATSLVVEGLRMVREKYADQLRGGSVNGD